jgi:hypothetical protein
MVVRSAVPALRCFVETGFDGPRVTLMFVSITLLACSLCMILIEMAINCELLNSVLTPCLPFSNPCSKRSRCA